MRSTIDKTKQELSRELNRDASEAFVPLQVIIVDAHLRHCTLDLEFGDPMYPLCQ